MNRAEHYAGVERLVLAASERLADDAEASDRLLAEALAAVAALPAIAPDDRPTLAAARQLAAAVESLTHRLDVERARVARQLSAVDAGRTATHGYAQLASPSRFARVG
ncbi:MAG: hypothetical protein HY275_18535 [Gemmatimonadetes bacterium]|nr:hypothetical protein [Gemmatimonadota bacterium]